MDSKVTGAMTMKVINQSLDQSIARGATSQNERGDSASLTNKESNTKPIPNHQHIRHKGLLTYTDRKLIKYLKSDKAIEAWTGSASEHFGGSLY